MRFLFQALAIAGCVTAASAAQATPISYDEASSGDIVASIGNIPLFNLGVGNNVIAGSQFFGSDLRFDQDIFSFVVPQDSVLRFVTVEFTGFSFEGALTGFGPNYTILQDAFTGLGQFIDTSRSATSDFTNVLTSIGPQNLFTRLPIGAGTYDWIDGAGRTRDSGSDITAANATWDYRLTFGVESVAVHEPDALALLGCGLLAFALIGRQRKPRVRERSGRGIELTQTS